VATSTSKGFPYPEGTDPADVPADVQLLAEAVDAHPGVASLTQVQIDALTVGQKWAGRIVWNQTLNKHQFSDGAAWADVTATAFGNLDGGDPSSVYGGTTNIDAGGVS